MPTQFRELKSADYALDYRALVNLIHLCGTQSGLVCGVQGVWKWKSPFLQLLFHFPRIILSWVITASGTGGVSCRPHNGLESIQNNSAGVVCFSFSSILANPRWTIHCSLNALVLCVLHLLVQFTCVELPPLQILPLCLILILTFP